MEEDTENGNLVVARIISGGMIDRLVKHNILIQFNSIFGLLLILVSLCLKKMCDFLLKGLLKVGDVILEVNGVPVTSPEQLQVEVAKARGDGIQLKVGSPLVDKPVMTGRQVDDSLSSESPTPSSSTEQITQTKPKFYKYNKPTTKFEGKKSLVSFYLCQNSAKIHFHPRNAILF